MVKNDLDTRLKDEQGVTLIIVAIAIVMLLSFVALAVDIGFVKVTRNELQNVGDAAALAATRKLGTMHEDPPDPAANDCATARPIIAPVAQDVGGKNRAAGVNIAVVDNSSDIQIGDWDTVNKVFTPNKNPPNAVRITARRDSNANGPIDTFFARIFGANTVDVSAMATAALTGVCTVNTGELIPVGIPWTWFVVRDPFCNQPIRFYPTGDATGCAGWLTFERWPASESYLRKDILEGWLVGTFTSPFAEKGDQFSYIGGSLGDQTFTAFLNLFNYMRTRDGDGDDSVWTAMVVVYMPEAAGGEDCPDPADVSCGCANPNQKLRTIGFATVVITDVKPPPIKEIWGRVICDMFEPGRGGCNNFGTLGTIPGLVAEVNQVY